MAPTSTDPANLQPFILRSCSPPWIEYQCYGHLESPIKKAPVKTLRAPTTHPWGVSTPSVHSNHLSFVIEVTITLWPSVENKSLALAVFYPSLLAWHWCGVYYLPSRIRVSWGMPPIHNTTALCWRYLKVYRSHSGIHDHKPKENGVLRQQSGH